MTDKMLNVLVVGPANGWHVLDLKRAASSLPAIRVDSIDFGSLHDEVNDDQGLPNSSDHPKSSGSRRSVFNYDALLTRAMPAGSLEQIVFRMDMLARIESRGVFQANPPKAIETAVDKYLALWRLHEAGIPVPATRVSQSVPQALADFERLGGDVVVKPVFGSLGKQILRINDIDQAGKHFRELVQADRLIYQQTCIDHGGWDVRVLVIGDSVFAMKRSRPGEWITNIHQGGTGETFETDPVVTDLARRSAAAVGTQIAGVDLLWDPSDQRWLVLEVNAAPGWRSLSQVLNIDIAAQILNWLQLKVN